MKIEHETEILEQLETQLMAAKNTVRMAEKLFHRLRGAHINSSITMNELKTAYIKLNSKWYIES